MNADLIEQYRQLHREKPAYGSSATAAAEIAAVIKARGLKTVLDFGCGKGGLVRELRRMLPDVVIHGYDPAISEFDVIPLKQYDMVACLDVLEHLDQNSYQEELGSIHALNPRWLFCNISCRPAMAVLPNGQNAHTLLRSPRWWKETLLAHFEGFFEQSGRWNEQNRDWLVSFAKPIDLAGQRVAIVGNSPQALENTEDIDGFDCVIRFNRYKAGPGLEAIGTRCDLWCGWVSRFTAEWMRESGARFVLDVAADNNKSRHKHLQSISHLVDPENVIDARSIADRVRFELAGNPVPTSGLSAIAWAMKSGAKEIYLTGFSFQRGPTDHYFTDTAFPFDHKMHSVEAERRWLAARKNHPGLRFDKHIAERLAAT